MCFSHFHEITVKPPVKYWFCVSDSPVSDRVEVNYFHEIYYLNLIFGIPKNTFKD